MTRARLKPLSQQTLVITGATSGIGLATARRAARRGACVFLISRSAAELRTLTEEIQAEGGRAAWAAADVSDPEALAAAIETCQRLFGGFDTWVNNAGVAIYGAIRETVIEDQRRLFETNYWGVVNGSLAAVEHLRQRPGGGAIINVGSILSDVPLPVQGIYSASKHAMKGFTNALRMELLREGSPITVSLIKPAAVDTPYRQHARNLTGHAVRSPQPVYATHVVADTILYCASHPIREITVGGGGRLAASLYSLFPGLAEPLFAWFAPKLMEDKKTSHEPFDDGLYDPNNDGLHEEAYYPMVREFSVLAEVRKHPGIAAGVVAVLAGVGLATLLLNQRTGPTRYQMLRDRIDPRGWFDVDTDDLRERVDALADAVRRGVRQGWAAASEQASDYAENARHRGEQLADEVRDRGRDWFKSAQRSGRKAMKRGRKDSGRYAREAAEYARQAGDYARAHAKEGGAILALVTLAAAVGAAALESRRSDSKIRELFDRF